MVARAVRWLSRGVYEITFEEAPEKSEASHLDSHADTCTGGKNMVLIPGTSTKRVEVSGFSSDIGSIKGVPVGTCAMAYDDPSDGITYIIMFGECIYFGERMEHSLLCPNQIRSNGNIVEDTPRQFDKKSQHGMTLRNEDTEEQLFVPFSMEGVISVIENTRKPTQQELEECAVFWATSDVDWNPYSHSFAEDERKCLELESKVVEDPPITVETDLYFRYLNAMNSRSLSEVGIAGDGKILDRLVHNSKSDFGCESKMDSAASALSMEVRNIISEVRTRGVRSVRSISTSYKELGDLCEPPAKEESKVGCTDFGD